MNNNPAISDGARSSPITIDSDIHSGGSPYAPANQQNRMSTAVGPTGNPAVLSVAPPPLRIAPGASAPARMPPQLTPSPAFGPIGVVPTLPGPGQPAPAFTVPPVAPAGPSPVLSSAGVRLSIPSATVRTVLPSAADSSVTPRSRPASQPIHVIPPSSVPKEVSGQVLTLPGGIMHKLDLNKNIALKVNGTKYMVPPSCMMSTPDGVRVYLPPGYLPDKMSQGPSKPLGIRVGPISDSTQNLSVSSIANAEAATAVNPEASGTSRRVSSKRLREVKNRVCHFHVLHVGFDCMLAIFEYLDLPNLLR